MEDGDAITEPRCGGSAGGCEHTPRWTFQWPGFERRLIACTSHRDKALQIAKDKGFPVSELDVREL